MEKKEMSKEQRSKLHARYQALSNAAEMIRNHHEGGGIGDETFEGDCSLDEYVSEAKKIARALDRKASKILPLITP